MHTEHGNLKSHASGRIAGIVTALPVDDWANGDVAGATEAERITGVQRRRRISGLQTAESLMCDAARHLMAKLHWSADSISLLVVVTQTGSRPIPASAFTIQHSLGLPHGCMVVPLNWACSGYVQGLWTAMRMVMPGQRCLLLVGDTLSQILDRHDRATYPVFGDGCSATAIEKSHHNHAFVFGSDGSGAAQLACEAGGKLTMDGTAVFNFTLDRVPDLLADTFNGFAEPDLILFHQANRFMLDHLVKKSKLRERFPNAVVPMNIARFGNTSSCSIPLLMCEHPEANAAVLAGGVIAMFGFGAGWSWAGVRMDMQDVEVCELIQSGLSTV